LEQLMGQAPIRRQLAAPAPEPGLLERVGNFFQQAFPTINAARVSVRDGINDAAANGDYGRVAGNVARGMVTYPAAAVTDALAPLGGAIINGGGGLLGGLTGSRGDTTVVRTQPVVAAPNPRTAVTQALAQGREAPATPITPQDALASALQRILTSPRATMGDISRAGGLVPAVTKNAPKGRDTVLAQTAALSEAIFNHAVGEIDAAAKAGTITPDQAKVGKEKATAEWFQRNGGLVGFDPSKMVQAQLLQGADGEE
jgi:hypothetical protein